MDYFETLNSSKEAELAYASWYSKLPEERKARLLADGYQFALDMVRYNLRKQNPFLTEADAMFRFIEIHQKETYSQEVFSFIREKMAARSEAEWKERFKAMKKALGWSYDDMARFVGAASGDSVKASVNRQLPAFAKLAVCVFERMSGKVEIK
jgi:hypothetical protein